jgi:hypothetical protein
LASCAVQTAVSEKRNKDLTPKLYKIWEKASRELKQVNHSYGNAGRKEACALGAIVYYASNAKTCNPSKIPLAERLIYSNMVAKWERLSGKEISKLNDKEGWTFEEFAKNARALDC